MKSKLIIFVFLSEFIFPNKFCKAQTGLALEIVNLINDARTDPATFLKKHQEEIKSLDASYISYLQKTKPVSKIIWDKELEAMGKKAIENNNLDPKYSGTNKICGFASGSSAGGISQNALNYVCDLYKNIHNQDYAFIGIYFNATKTGYNFQLGMSCDKKLIPFTFSEKIDSSMVDFAKLNTGKKFTWMSEIDKKMILEINFVRAYPKVYAKIIAQHLNDESEKKDGLAKDVYEAGMELIDELNKQEPRSILIPLECVYKAAKNHANDCARRKIMAHEGSDGKQPWDRILEVCTELKEGNENLAGAAGENPREPVINLLLDDGISSRGHRYNMLDANWVYVGCSRYVMDKNEYYTLWGWVQNFAK